MSKHIINTFRKFVLSAAFKALPLRSARLVEPEPVKNPPSPQTDAWMFDAHRTLGQHMDELKGGMSHLSDSLGRLHEVVSKVATATPVSAERGPAHISGALWSDTLLFDGEPQMSVEHIPAVHDDYASLLFDDEACDLGILGNAKPQRYGELASH